MFVLAGIAINCLFWVGRSWATLDWRGYIALASAMLGAGAPAMFLCAPVHCRVYSRWRHPDLPILSLDFLPGGSEVVRVEVPPPLTFFIPGGHHGNFLFPACRYRNRGGGSPTPFYCKGTSVPVVLLIYFLTISCYHGDGPPGNPAPSSPTSCLLAPFRAWVPVTGFLSVTGETAEAEVLPQGLSCFPLASLLW